MSSPTDLLEPPAFELHQIYRALSVIANESDSIQAELYEAMPAAGQTADRSPVL
mgnify:CR=1 FL=1